MVILPPCQAVLAPRRSLPGISLGWSLLIASTQGKVDSRREFHPFGNLDSRQFGVEKRNSSLTPEWDSSSDPPCAWSCNSPQVLGEFRGASMARLRERKSSRRGSRQGSSSRTPAADEHHHCCCCYCYRRARATPLQAGQLVEVGCSDEGKLGLPSFGSAVFTLGSSKDNAGINSHISVLFTKIPEGNVDGKPPGLAEPPPESTERENPVLQPPTEAGTSGKEPLLDP